MRIKIIADHSGRVLGAMGSGAEQGEDAPSEAGLVSLEGQTVHELQVPDAELRQHGLASVQGMRLDLTGAAKPLATPKARPRGTKARRRKKKR